MKREWNYFVDAEGHLWHDGFEFADPPTLLFFMQNMERLPDGRIQAICMGETCWITAEDCPYVIQRIEPQPKVIGLVFPGDYREDLDPTTLFVGDKNVLYCTVRGGAFTARFNRTSYLDLAKQVRYDPKTKLYSIRISGRDYPIRGVVAVS